MIAAAQDLLDACMDGVNMAQPGQVWEPKDGRTYCNKFVGYVARKMGCHDLDNILANDMVLRMEGGPSWVRTEMEEAHERADLGLLVVAGEWAEPHGHVCIVIPGEPVLSGKWGRMAPLVANVGKNVFIGKGVNFAFKKPPRFWTWTAKKADGEA